VLLQLLGTDIENSLLKYRVSYRHLTFNLSDHTMTIMFNTMKQKLLQITIT